MFKKTLVTVVTLTTVLVAGHVYAQSCGGTIVSDNDCTSNNRPYAESCCPSGYRVQGVAYNDMNKSDYVDAVSAVCRHVVKGNDMMPTDFQTAPVTHVCEKVEVMSGISCKDMPGKGSGHNSDILDGCTANCMNPTSKQTRMLYSADLAGNGRPYVTHTIDLPNRIVGVLYKDGDWKGDYVGGSDRADCATVSYKYQPIVQ
ncbi:MAG: hypothetical protein ACD_62C00293G0015 [uncultured bacterium]|nr:MAG: hypothetical protein ACD_62C00293G0015 [uncultured bacterium]HLD43951.1 hypothetical protein [bacterium]